MAAVEPTKEIDPRERELRVAARDGDMETVQRLVVSKVNVKAFGAVNKKTALHLAAENDHNVIVFYLLQVGGADPLQGDKDNKTAFMLATDRGHKHTVELLAKYMPGELKKIRERTLRVAARDGVLTEVLARVAARDIDINACDVEDQKTALHLAAQNNRSDIVSILLAAGADPSPRDKNQKTAMMLASEAGHQETLAVFKNPPVPLKPSEEKEIDENLVLEGYNPQRASFDKIKTITGKLKNLTVKEWESIKAIQARYWAEDCPRIAATLQVKLFGQIKAARGRELPEEDRARFQTAFQLYEIVNEVIQPTVNGILQLSHDILNDKLTDFMLGFIVHTVYATCIKAKKQFEIAKNAILDEIKNLVKNKDPYINKKVEKSIQKKLTELSDIFVTKILRVIQAEFYAILGKPKGYLEFIERYFPDLGSLQLLSYESFEACSATARVGNHKPGIDIQNKILDLLEQYFEDCNSEIIALFKSKGEDNADPSAWMDLRDVRYNLEVFDPELGPSMRSYPQAILLQYFLRGKRLIIATRDFVPSEPGSDVAHLLQQFKAEKGTFSKSLNLKTPPPDWESVHAKDRKAKKILEAKEREERKAQQSTEQLRAFKLKQQQLADEKEQGEKAEIANAMIKNLAAADKEMLNLAESILQGKVEVEVSFFCKLILLLKIPGSEVIKDPTHRVPGNKLTLHHKPHFQAFVIHMRHGRDEDDLVPSEGIKKLIALLNTFGITKDNLRSKVEESQRVSKCKPVRAHSTQT